MTDADSPNSGGDKPTSESTNPRPVKRKRTGIYLSEKELEAIHKYMETWGSSFMGAIRVALGTWLKTKPSVILLKPDPGTKQILKFFSMEGELLDLVEEYTKNYTLTGLTRLAVREVFKDYF